MAYFNREDNRHTVIKQVLDDVKASNGSRLIATSAFTLIEATYLKEELNQQRLDPDTENLMDLMWYDRSVIRIIPVSAEIAQRTRGLRRRLYGTDAKLTRADATHIATAIWLEVNEVNSYDGDFLRLNDYFTFLIRTPQPPPPPVDNQIEFLRE